MEQQSTSARVLTCLKNLYPDIVFDERRVWAPEELHNFVTTILDIRFAIDAEKTLEIKVLPENGPRQENDALRARLQNIATEAVRVREALLSDENRLAIVDTIWIADGETLVDWLEGLAEETCAETDPVPDPSLQCPSGCSVIHVPGCPNEGS